MKLESTTKNEVAIMSIPANIATELASLQAQVTAATPLNNAPLTTIKAMQLNAGNLVNDIQSALTTTALSNIIPTTDSTLLDTWAPPPDAVTMVAGFNAVVIASQNQNKLSLLRGVAGRAASNLSQLV
jgi:hypothetical protein